MLQPCVGLPVVNVDLSQAAHNELGEGKEEVMVKYELSEVGMQRKFVVKSYMYITLLKISLE